MKQKIRSFIFKIISDAIMHALQPQLTNEFDEIKQRQIRFNADIARLMFDFHNDHISIESESFLMRMNINPYSRNQENGK